MMIPVQDLYPWEGPMPILRLEGSPREMGRKHGEACSAWIKLVAEDYWQVLQNPPLDMPRRDILDGVRAIERLIVGHTDEAYLEEMRGIAEGAQLTYEDVFLANCGYDLMKARSNPVVRAEMFSRFERLTPGCSWFAAWGQATEGGKMICAHNNDGPRYPSQFQVIMVARPEEGFAYISPSLVGRLGQHSMMNSQGLLVVGTALDNGAKNKADEVGVPLSVMFRHIAQHCSTTAEAVETFAGLPVLGGNLVLADRNRDVEIIQVTPDFRASVKPGPERDYLHVTNHALVEEIKPYLLLRPLNSSTHHRYQTIKRELDTNYGHITPHVAKEIMSSHYDWSVQDMHPCENTPCRHHEFEGEWGGTNRCTVWDLDALTAEVALGNPCNADWVTVSAVL